jgi:hypothetical protein
MSGDHNQHQKPTGKGSLQVEAMKQALEALEKLPSAAWHGSEAGVRNYEAISVLRQAIDQAEKDQAEFEELVAKVEELEKEACEIIRNDKEIKDWEAIAADQAMTIAMMKAGQEPVAWIDGKDFAALYSKGTIDCDLKLSRLTAIDIPLYAAPPQREWVGLTENEMWAVENAIPDKVITDRDWCIHFARAIETKLKEKNCEPRQYKDLCDND